MVLVDFRGCGDWFIKGSNGTRLAINRDFDEFAPIFLLEDRYCSEFSGVFKLTEEDEAQYLRTESKEYLNNMVVELIPCSHPDSAFSKMVESGKLSAEDIDRCFFRIQKKKKERRNYSEVPYHLELLAIDRPINTETITQTERSTMLKLIIGMAIDAYGYDPKRTRNTATGDNRNGISAKLLCHGIEITDDTIRKYLNEAKKLLPEQDQ